MSRRIIEGETVIQGGGDPLQQGICVLPSNMMVSGGTSWKAGKRAFTNAGTH